MNDLVKTVPDFQTTLASKVAVGATNATLTSATDDDGVALPTGTYAFTIDRKSANKEYIECTLTGTALTNIKTIARGTGVATAGFANTHRKGAEVIISDFVIIKRIANLLDGTTDFDADAPLSYDADPSFTDSKQIVTKGYADGIAVAGGADASTSVKGISKMSVAPASPTNPIAVGDNDTRVPTQGENDALVGTSGTPSTSNKYVTNDDTSNAGVSGKVVRLNGTSYPAADGSNITGVSQSKASYTAGNNIAQNDAVYVTAANTVSKLGIASMGTGTSISTPPTTNGANKSLPLSTNGMYIHIQGGGGGTNGKALTAQVRTMNALETDFSNGSEVVLYNTSNGASEFDVVSIGTDKFLAIFQADTAGVGAGIKTIAFSVSGTTITAGSPVTIEAFGNIGDKASVVKLDTDKAMIVYQKDSDGDFYGQVLTVSGTSISTNTAYLIKTGSSFYQSALVQTGTNAGVIVYSQNNPNDPNLYGRTYSVSGTVITFNAVNTLLTLGGSSSNFILKLGQISSTKFLLSYMDSAVPTAPRTAIMTLSGSTLTLGGALTFSGVGYLDSYMGMHIINEINAIVGFQVGNTSYNVYLLNISGATPTEISSQTLSHSNTASLYNSVCIVKIKPWVYLTISGGSNADGDYLIKFTPQGTHVGIAESAIAQAASGNILQRYASQTLSGITLTAGSTYYVDDSAQPTTSASLTAPTLGIAISTTKILLQ